MKIKNLIQTCSACPSQWEAINEDGQEIYIRYRWGNLIVSLGVLGEMIFNKQIGDQLDGCISTEEMLGYTGLTVE